MFTFPIRIYICFCFFVTNLLVHSNISQIFVTAIQLHYRAMQFTAVFLTIWHLWGYIYFAGDGTYFFFGITLILFSSCVNHTYKIYAP